MLKKVVKQILAPHHFWREDALAYAAAMRSRIPVPNAFDELSQLYVNSLTRGMALSMTGLFIPVYMLQMGYSLASILMVVAWYFTFRGLVMDLMSGFTVAKIGPKRTLLIGSFLLIGSTAMFLTLGAANWPIWLLGGVWGTSSSFFFVPFNVYFSKVKNRKYAGKELSYLTVMDRIGNVGGPILGGTIATVFGAQYIFLVAGIILISGVIAMFRTPEPVRQNQQLSFKGLDVGPLKRDIISFTAIGIDNNLRQYLWPLFLGLFVLSSSAAYAELGALASIAVVLGVLSTYIYGRIADKQHGRRVLRITATLNALIHVARPLVGTFNGALAINFANEAVASGYRLAYFKGYYQAADSHPGQRIAYMTAMESIASLVRATMWWGLVMLATLVSAHNVMLVGFLIGAAASSLIMTERFKGLSVKPIMQRA